MTVDVIETYETQSLIRPLQPSLYPVKIPTIHPQLRNFISTADDDIIYYANDQSIYALHLPSRKREYIASLPWKPQCLDARHGWIAVGGPINGRCAFICVNGKHGRVNSIRHEAEVDALLPLDLDPESRLLARSYFQRLRSTSSPSRSKPEVQIHELGTESEHIMNSVSLHRLSGEKDGPHDDLVCVMTLIATLKFPTKMNHAALSPDGSMMVAVGDEPKAFFCTRIWSTSSMEHGVSYTWRQIAESTLVPNVRGDACFTTAFSPSGHVCAVAQQSGIITIFDVELIREDREVEEAVVGILRSSRPSFGPDYIGAVRSMSFGPRPWDLLAWAEDRGRVCVTDLRTGCRSRQTIVFDLDAPDLNRSSVAGFDAPQGGTTAEQRQLDMERRFLQSHDEAINAQNDLVNIDRVADYIERSAADRRLQRDSTSSGERNDLTESERQIIDLIRTQRSQGRNPARSDYDSQRPFSVNYLHDNSDHSDADTSPVPPLVRSDPSTSEQLATWTSMRDTMRRNHLDRSRTADRTAYQPRRRSSVVISSSNNSNPSRQSSSSHPSSLAPIGSSVPTLSASPSRLASVVANNTENMDWTAPDYEAHQAWQTVQDAMGSASSDNETTSESRRHSRRELERHSRDPVASTAMLRLLHQQQQRQRRQQQQQQQQSSNQPRLEYPRSAAAREMDIMLRRAMMAGGEREGRARESNESNAAYDIRMRSESGVRSMGLGWRSDGSILYVATEEGILEYKVSLDERRQFPSMEFQ
ncbi:MAG: hypothetical protein Q9183_002794 [Haloplaca sp. 2 TL-2023]